jgi:hypothetical protein
MRTNCDSSALVRHSTAPRPLLGNDVRCTAPRSVWKLTAPDGTLRTFAITMIGSPQVTSRSPIPALRSPTAASTDKLTAADSAIQLRPAQMPARTGRDEIQARGPRSGGELLRRQLAIRVHRMHMAVTAVPATSPGGDALRGELRFLHVVLLPNAKLSGGALIRSVRYSCPGDDTHQSERHLLSRRRQTRLPGSAYAVRAAVVRPERTGSGRVPCDRGLSTWRH